MMLLIVCYMHFAFVMNLAWFSHKLYWDTNFRYDAMVVYCTRYCIRGINENTNSEIFATSFVLWGLMVAEVLYFPIVSSEFIWHCIFCYSFSDCCGFC